MLLRQWAAVNYPGIYLQEQIRLGPTVESVKGVTLSPALEAALRVWNWYADGWLAAPTENLLIEAKVHPDPGAVGQVLFYRSLVLQTPAIVDRLAFPIVPMVLFAEDDSGVTKFAQSLGCRVAIFTPDWIADYLTQVQFRRRGTPSSSPSIEPADQLSTLSTTGAPPQGSTPSGAPET